MLHDTSLLNHRHGRGELNPLQSLNASETIAPSIEGQLNIVPMTFAVWEAKPNVPRGIDSRGQSAPNNAREQ